MNLFDRLSGLPLFLGLSQSELSDILGQTKIDFVKLSQGTTFIRQNDACDKLIYLLGGTLSSTRISSDESYTIAEQLPAVRMLEADKLFGLSRHYDHSYSTLSSASLMILPKAEIIKLLDNYQIFRVNFVNLLSTLAQQHSREPWRKASTTIREAIIRFFRLHCAVPSGPKDIRIKMTSLAHELNCSRLEVSIALNALRSEGLLSLSRGRITIPNLQSLK